MIEDFFFTAFARCLYLALVPRASTWAADKQMDLFLLPTSRFRLFRMAFHKRALDEVLPFMSSSNSNFFLLSSSSSMTTINNRVRNPTENRGPESLTFVVNADVIDFLKCPRRQWRSDGATSNAEDKQDSSAETEKFLVDQTEKIQEMHEEKSSLVWRWENTSLKSKSLFF